MATTKLAIYDLDDLDLVFAKLKKERLSNLNKELNSLRFKKAINLTATKILEKQSKQLSNEDYKDISLNSYKDDGYLQTRRLKRMLNMDIVKKEIDNTLQQYMLNNGYNKEKYKDLLEKAEQIAVEKKQAGVLIQVADRIERFIDPKTAQQHEDTYKIDFVKQLKDAETGEQVKVTRSIKYDNKADSNSRIQESENTG